MSGQESRPPAPRRKKLVLRKIAGVDASDLPASSNSYTGPLPVVRPPPRPALARESHGVDDEEPQIISDEPIAPTKGRIEAQSAFEEASSGARAAAALTAPVPAATADAKARSASLPDWRAAPMTLPLPLRAPATEPPARSSVAPTVATLPPPEPVAAHARFSVDSKVLAVGGAIAAAMLLVALGVFLGVHSTRSAASALGPDPIVPTALESNVTGAASCTPAPQTAVDAPPSASASPKTVEAIAPGTGLDAISPPVAIAASQLPMASVAKTRRAPVLLGLKSAEAAAGWSVPAMRTAPTVPTVAAVNGRPTEDTPSHVSKDEAPLTAPTGVAAGAEVLPAAPVAVDPFVQAVREDIREDEARGKP